MEGEGERGGVNEAVALSSSFALRVEGGHGFTEAGHPTVRKVGFGSCFALRVKAGHPAAVGLPILHVDCRRGYSMQEVGGMIREAVGGRV
ncbi:MAG: hypothetical protein CMJ35_01225 [Phycisphaerae bacterium]|nr:hypothetical protein [Phycisphaerae bacterium]